MQLDDYLLRTDCKLLSTT